MRGAKRACIGVPAVFFVLEFHWEHVADLDDRRMIRFDRARRPQRHARAAGNGLPLQFRCWQPLSAEKPKKLSKQRLLGD